MKRRDLLAAGAAAGAAAVIGVRGAPPEIAAPPVRTLFRPDVVGRLVSVMVPTGQLALAQAAEPRSIASLTTDVQQARALRRQAQYEALGSLLEVLIGDVDRAAAPGTATQRQALRLGVHTYNLAASLLKKLGDSGLAMMAADRALRAAHLLEDPVLAAAASYRLANVFRAANRFTDARRVALAAAATVDPGETQLARGTAMCGGLLLVAAVSAASSADEAAAWELLGEARAVASLLKEDYVDAYVIFGPTDVAIHGVQVAATLGDGRGALLRGERVKPDRLPHHLLERRAQFFIDLARGYALKRDYSEATATLLHADQTAPQEVRLNGEVQTLVRALLRTKMRPSAGLRRLGEHVGAG